MIDMFIPIHPRPQERPRHRVIQAKGGKKAFATTYDPQSSKDYKAAIAKHARDAGVKPFAADLPLALTVYFYLEKPKSVKRLEPTVKPDLDNLEKAIKDALKGIAWHDDSQVCMMSSRKCYASSTSPGIWIGIRELKD